MIGLIQRVKHAQVDVDRVCVGKINAGLLVLVGVERNDTEAQVEKLAKKLLTYRVFEDEQGKMNLNVKQAGGGVLLVSQFTLAADTKSGTRPGFSSAAPPEHALPLFNSLVACVRQSGLAVETGQFGSDMQVSLVNDGPVTFWLQVG